MNSVQTINFYKQYCFMFLFHDHLKQDLKRENLALLGALEEHQNTLQMVMTKYRLVG